MRVLAVGAHPDDIELLCGGTLALYVAAGASVTMAIATNGDVGGSGRTRSENATIRHAEALAGARALGAELHWMGLRDEFLFNDASTRIAFIDAIRAARPDLMFVHSPEDYHPDHRVAGQVAEDARIPASVPLVETTLPECRTIPRCFIMDTVGGHNFLPTVAVDISTALVKKANALRQHASQEAWLHEAYNVDYAEMMEMQSARRGIANGVRHAEVFREVVTFPHERDLSVLPNVAWSSPAA